MRLLALPLSLAALVALPLAATAQQGRPVPVFPYPYFALPALSGAGFGSALSTPAPQAATGNPAALPGQSGVGLSLRASTTTKDEELVRTVEGAASDERYVSVLDPAVSRLPYEAGAAWARGPLRVAVGYARPLDGDRRARSSKATPASTSENVMSSRLETAGVSVAYAVAVAPGVRVTPGVRLGFAWVDNENRLGTGGTFATSYTERRTGSGATWTVGLLVEGEALPVRFGVAFAPRITLDGEETRRCTPSSASCGGPSTVFKTRGSTPARLDASVGAAQGAWAADATLSRVFWQGDQDRARTALRDAFEGSVNVHYALQPGLSLALGLNQTARSPLEDSEGETFDVFDTYPTRFVLVGATLTRGPIVLDAAYVNGSLLSDRGSRHHLGSLGVGYRF